MQAIVVVAAEQGIATLAKDVQARTAGYQNVFLMLPGVPDAFDEVLPSGMLMQLVED